MTDVLLVEVPVWFWALVGGSIAVERLVHAWVRVSAYLLMRKGKGFKATFEANESKPS